MGAISVLVLLAILVAQAVTGLTSDDEITSAGPLVGFVSSAWVNSATFYHANVGKLALLGLIALHIGAIIFYQLGKNQNLIRPMIDGDKEIDISIVSSKDNAATRLLALAVLIGCALLVASAVGLAV